MAYILALDQGTTSSRAILFDHGGAVVAVAQREFRQIFPQPGWVEHDPREIWATQIAVARRGAGARPGVAPATSPPSASPTSARPRSSGTATTGRADLQRHRLAGPAHGRLLRRAEGRRARGPRAADAPGLVLDAYFSGTKLALDPRQRAGRPREGGRAGELAFGTVDTWLIWKLTGGRVHVTDVSNASRTMLFNIHTLAWDDELLRMLGVPRERAARGARLERGVRPRRPPAWPRRASRSPASPATSRPRCSARRASSPGMAKNTYGTGCFLLHEHRRRSPSRRDTGLLTTVAWQVGGADRVRARRQRVHRRRGRAVAARRARHHPHVGGGRGARGHRARHRRRLPRAGLRRAWARRTGTQYARGAIVGLTRGTDAGPHRARRAREHRLPGRPTCSTPMQRDAGIALAELRVDGGAARQRPADAVPGRPARACRSCGRQVTETTALGAAYLAGLAVGFWGSPDEIARQWQAERRFEPAMARRRRPTALRGAVARRARAREGLGSAAGRAGMNRAEMLSRVARAPGALGHGDRRRRRHRRRASPSTRPRAATTCCCSSSTTSARAPRAAAPSSCTAASATSSRATSRW